MEIQKHICREGKENGREAEGEREISVGKVVKRSNFLQLPNVLVKM